MSRLWRRPGRGWSSSRGSLSWPRWNDDGDDGGDGDDSDVDGAGAGETDMRKIFDIVFHRVFSHPSEPNRGQRWRPYLLASMQGGSTLYSIDCLYLCSVLSIIFPIKATACFCWGKWENAFFLPNLAVFLFLSLPYLQLLSSDGVTSWLSGEEVELQSKSLARLNRRSLGAARFPSLSLELLMWSWVPNSVSTNWFTAGIAWSWCGRNMATRGIRGLNFCQKLYFTHQHMTQKDKDNHIKQLVFFLRWQFQGCFHCDQR